ncbi:hypothetical protein ACIQU2_27465 [Pseudomonas sp. NPDC098740]|uniref:hypothetical protein n=1 Tax=Pseudomonas sp. NPDC098740 TaxID=3364486 RepID=UPI00383B7B35
MELNAWINSLAPIGASQVAAELLGVKRRTVDSWRRFEAPPSFQAALNIVIVTRGVVDFNGIYTPFWNALIEGKAKFTLPGQDLSFKE